MIEYVLGRAGKGKTHYIYNKIGQALRADQNRLILLVPEQYTLQAERDLIAQLKLPGLINAEVLSLTRLAERVFQEAGGLTRPLLNEQGRNMALRRVLEEVSPGLRVYAQAWRQPGFTAQFSTFLSELKQNFILPEQLDDLILSWTEDTLLKDKLHDAVLIYQGFNRFMEQRRYLDLDDYLLMLTEKIYQVKFLEDCRVWVDSFLTYSPLTLRVVQELMLQAASLTVSITLDPARPDQPGNLFELSHYAFSRFREFAASHALPETVKTIEFNPANEGYKPELVHLEAEFMEVPARTYQSDLEAIAVQASSNIYSEAEEAARTITALAREQGLRWHDISVLVSDMTAYGTLIKRTFHEYGIPCFLDQKRGIMNSPMVRCILSLIDIIQGSYQLWDIMAWLKTGLGGLQREECEALEEYVLRYGIKGRRWKQPFTWGPAEQQEAMEVLRRTVMAGLIPLEKAFKEAQDCRSIIMALYNSLQEQGVGDTLESMITGQMQQGYWEAALETAQIWNIVWEIMDQLAALAGDLSLSPLELRRLLEEGFNSYELAIIPPTIDQVQVGDISRSASREVKVLLVLGATEAALPPNPGADGLLTQEERDRLTSRGLQLVAGRNRRISEENLVIYHTFSQPRELLLLSYPLADSEGRTVRPSLLIRQLQRTFPRLVITSDALGTGEQELAAVSTPGGTFKYLVKNRVGSNRQDTLWFEVEKWFAGRTDWMRKLAMIEDGLKLRRQPGPLPQFLLDKISPRPLITSISQLERYASCPFSHLLHYGLRPRERKIYSLKAPDLGDFLHKALHRFSLVLEKNGPGWQDLDLPTGRNLLNQVFEELVPEYGEGIFTSNARYGYLASRLQRIGERAVWTMARELQKGDFKPFAYEVPFARGQSLPPVRIRLAANEDMLIEGRIDRVDLCDEDGRLLVRVLDYKSGRKDLHMADVYYGINIQLLVYLKAVMAALAEGGHNVVLPAGMFYFTIDDPLVNTTETRSDKLESLLARELRLKGLVLNDVEVIRRMDKDLEGVYLPVSMNKDLTLARHTPALSAQDFAALFNHLEQLLQKSGREWQAGRIAIEPVKLGAKAACSTCVYGSICQFDLRMPDNRYRTLYYMDREQILKSLREDGEG